MKGLDTLIGAVLVIAITIAAITIVLVGSSPTSQRAQEIALFNEGKANIRAADFAIKSVIAQGNGASKSIDMQVSGGTYSVDTSAESVTFTFDSSQQIVGEGVSYTEDSVLVSGGKGTIIMSVSYRNTDIVDGDSFGKGSRTGLIRNNGAVGG